MSQMLYVIHDVFYLETLCGIILDWNLVHIYCFAPRLFELM